MARKIKEATDDFRYAVWGHYTKGIIIPILLLIAVLAIGFIDAGAEAGNFPKVKNATVQTIVILDTGEKYVVSEKDEKVTVNTYNTDDPEYWDICKY